MNVRAKLLAAGVLAAAVAFAQRSGGGGGEGPSMNAGIDREAMTGHPNSRLDMVSQMLNLNRDQKKEIKTAMDEGQKAAMPVREEMANARLAIAEAVASGKTGDDLKPALDKYAAAEVRMHQIELTAFARIYKSLEKEQLAKIQPFYAMMNGIFKGRNWNEMN